MQKVGSKVLSVSVGNLSIDEEFITPISFVFELVCLNLYQKHIFLLELHMNYKLNHTQMCDQYLWQWTATAEIHIPIE